MRVQDPPFQTLQTYFCSFCPVPYLLQSTALASFQFRICVKLH